MKNTLLEKALAIKQPVTTASLGDNFNHEMLDLTLAFINGEVTSYQVIKSLGINSGQIHSKLSSCLLTAAKHGMIEIKKVKNANRTPKD